MRDQLNAILTFIGSSSLTDEEFDSINLENSNDQVTVYNSLVEILHDRESSSNTINKLQYYFQAMGVNLSSEPSSSPQSNIFVGAPLDDDHY